MVAVLSAQLLVAADGRDSWVREAAGLVAHNTPYGEKGLVANFITERPHQVAYQWFRDDGVLLTCRFPETRSRSSGRRPMPWRTKCATCRNRRWLIALPMRAGMSSGACRR